jgi:hypothetical protein
MELANGLHLHFAMNRFIILSLLFYSVLSPASQTLCRYEIDGKEYVDECPTREENEDLQPTPSSADIAHSCVTSKKFANGECSYMLGFANIRDDDAEKIASNASKKCLNETSNSTGASVCVDVGSYQLKNNNTEKALVYLEKDCKTNGAACMILTGVHVRDNQPEKALSTAMKYCDTKYTMGIMESFITTAPKYCAQIIKSKSLPNDFALGAQRYLRDFVGDQAAGLPAPPRLPATAK